MRRIRVLLTCITILLVGCHRSRPTDAGITHIIQASDEMVAELLQAPMTVPDAVLNRARCVIAIPAMGAQINWGVATCRDDREQWQIPAAVRFIAAKPQPEDVFIVVMNERIANRLNSGALRLGSDATDRAGPLLQQIATVTDADLSADILSYTRKGGVLQGARISGQITLQRQQTIDVDPAQHFEIGRAHV